MKAIAGDGGPRTLPDRRDAEGSYDATQAEIRRLRKLEGRQRLAASLSDGGPVKSFSRDELAEAWGIDA